MREVLGSLLIGVVLVTLALNFVNFIITFVIDVIHTIKVVIRKIRILIKKKLRSNKEMTVKM
jgi:hypothetical protein